MSKPPPSSISDWIDLLLAWLKWPAAALSLSLLPGAAAAMFDLLARIAAQPWPMLTLSALGEDGRAGFRHEISLGELQ